MSRPRLRPAFFKMPRSWVTVSLAASAGVGAAASTARASGRVMPPRASAKAARKAGKYLAQVRAEPVVRGGAVPDGVLLGAGQHRDGLGQLGAGGQRPVSCRSVRSTSARTNGVAVVGFPARDRVPVPVAGHRHRVDGVDLAAGGAQAGGQQAAGCLDRHRDRVLGGVAVLGEQAGQLGQPGRVVADPAAGQQPPVPVHHCDVVVILGPVDPAVHVHAFLPFSSSDSRCLRRSKPRGARTLPNGRAQGHRHPMSRS